MKELFKISNLGNYFMYVTIPNVNTVAAANTLIFPVTYIKYCTR